MKENNDILDILYGGINTENYIHDVNFQELQEFQDDQDVTLLSDTKQCPNNVQSDSDYEVVPADEIAATSAPLRPL